MSPTRQLPFTSAELDELSRGLRDDSIDSVLGMLAAVVSVPEVLPSRVWLGELMGQAEFAGVEQAQRFAGLIMRLNNHVAQALMKRTPELVCPDRDADDACREFCDAYLDICAQANVDATKEDEIGEKIGTLFGYARLSDAELADDLGSAAKVAKFKQEVREALPEIIGGLHAVWLQQRTPPAAVRREGPKVGRNDPCACGSGKKYKKCCGAT